MLTRLATLSLLILWLGGCNKQAGDEENQDNPNPSTEATPNGTATPNKPSEKIAAPLCDEEDKVVVEDSYRVGEEVVLGCLEADTTLTFGECNVGGSLKANLYYYDHTDSSVKGFGNSLTFSKKTAPSLYVVGDISDNCQLYSNGRFLTKIMAADDEHEAKQLLAWHSNGEKLWLHVLQALADKHSAEVHVAGDGGKTWHKLNADAWQTGSIINSDLNWLQGNTYHVLLRINSDTAYVHSSLLSVSTTDIAIADISIGAITLHKDFSINNLPKRDTAYDLRVHEACGLEFFRRSGNSMYGIRKDQAHTVTPDANGKIDGLFAIGTPTDDCQVRFNLSGMLASVDSMTNPAGYPNYTFGQDKHFWVEGMPSGRRGTFIQLNCKNIPTVGAVYTTDLLWASRDGGRNWTHSGGTRTGKQLGLTHCPNDAGTSVIFDNPSVAWHSGAGMSRVMIGYKEHNGNFKWWIQVTN